MSSIYKRPENGIWYIQWIENGRKRKASLKTTDKKIAERCKREFEGEQDLVRHGLVDPRMNLDEAFEQWITTKTTLGESGHTRYRQAWWHLTKFFDSASIDRLGKIDSGHLSNYLGRRLTDGSAPKTVAEELLVLKAVMKWAVVQGIIRTIPPTWPKVKTPVASPETVGAYSNIEVRRILDHFRDHPAGPVLGFLAWTGARRGEAEALRVADVDLARGSVRIEQTKTATNFKNQFRTIEIHQDLRPILEAGIAGKSPCDVVFETTRKHRPAWLTQLLETACRQLKIQYRRIHGLRHSWISRMLTAGCPLAVVMLMAGHRNIATTQRYLTVSEQTGWVGRL